MLYFEPSTTSIDARHNWSTVRKNCTCHPHFIVSLANDPGSSGGEAPLLDSKITFSVSTGPDRWPTSRSLRPSDQERIRSM